MQSNYLLRGEVLRCPRCRLVQFRPASGLCRRCGVSLGRTIPGAPSSAAQSSGAEPAGAPLAKQLGAAIRRLRKERKLSQQDLASAMGTARTSVSRLERGLLLPSLPTIERATFALGIGIADLFLGLSRCQPETTQPRQERKAGMDKEQPRSPASQ